MKITSVQLHRLTLPFDLWDVITIDTDEGLRGWGEVTGCLDFFGMGSILESIRECLVGQEPDAISNCEKVLTKWIYPHTQYERVYSTLISGIDQALWDLLAKAQGVPLCVLYGAKGVEEIPLYANLNKALRSDRRPEILAANGKRAMEEGFTMVKCTPFDEVEPMKNKIDLTKSFEKISALNSVVSFEKIALDCHQRFSRSGLAYMVQKLLEKYGNPYWIEDPNDVEKTGEVQTLIERYPEILWTAGEDALSLKDLMTIMSSGVYDTIMPDLKYCGGPSAVKAFIPVAESLGKFVTMHNPNGIIATAHSAHLSAMTSSGMPMEYPFGLPEWRRELSEPAEPVKNGKFVFTGKNGIGVELKEETLKEYGKTYSKGTLVPYTGRN